LTPGKQCGVHDGVQEFEPPIDGHDPNNFLIAMPQTLDARCDLIGVNMYSVLVPLLGVVTGARSFYVTIR